jgi:hypothetical protein
LLSQKKQRNYTEFACYVKNYTSRALSVTVPLGFVESLPTLDASEQETLLEDNRERYSEPPVLPSYLPSPRPRRAARSTRSAPDEPEHEQAAELTTDSETPTASAFASSVVEREQMTLPVVPKSTPQTKGKTIKIPGVVAQSGRGGQQHKYLQHLIKQLAEERGFRASIEESILQGAGRVDVALLRGDQRIAFEISVTTNQDHELGNVEKCLAAGYGKVVLVGQSGRHTKALSKFVEENLEEGEQGKVKYVAAEDLIEYFDLLGEPPQATEQTVRGYKVRTVQQLVDPKEAGIRRKAIAEVIARSLRKSPNA